MSKRRAPTVSQVASPPESTVPTSPPPEAAFSVRAAALTGLVYETGKANARRAEELLRSFGFQVIVADDAQAARRHVDSGAAHVVLCGIPGAETLARAVLALGRARPALVVTVSGETSSGLAAAESHGADAFALRPFKRDALAATLHAVVALRDERARTLALEAELAAGRERMLRHGDVDPASGFHHFEFFKKLLVIELKRARRYGYSLAACLVAIDEGGLEGLSAGARAKLKVQVARKLKAVVRDIDLPVDYADNHVLVFLPYTDLAGAERAGQRMEHAVRGIDGVEGETGARVQPTISVGISALKPGKGVSFAKLVRDASMALRAAQLKGGARVVVKS